MKITILTNNAIEGGYIGADVAYIDDALENAKSVYETLTGGGHEVNMIDVGNDNFKSIIKELKNNTDVVFNLTESVGLTLVLKVIKELEKQAIPFCGAGYQGHLMTSNKILCKQAMKKFGITTPDWRVIENLKDAEYFNLPFPAIVKSATEHGSVSVSQASVVNNKKELVKQVNDLFDKYDRRPLIVEEYIGGREFNAAIVGSNKWAECLPLSEVRFGKTFANGKWPICTYAGNYETNSSDYNDSIPYPVTDLDKKTENKIKKMAIRAALKTKCFDYCRIDIRYDEKQKKAYFVDINSYPCLKDDPRWDTITISRKAVGWDFLKYLEEIARSGIKRNQMRFKHTENYLNINDEYIALV